MRENAGRIVSAREAGGLEQDGSEGDSRADQGTKSK